MTANNTTSYSRNETTSTALEWTTPISDCVFEPGKCDLLQIIATVNFSITIAVVAVTMACIFLLRKYIRFHQRILCHLLISNLLYGIVNISNDGRVSSEGSARCILQGFFNQTFAFSQYMWIWALTIFLFNHLIRSKDTARYEWVYIGVCWGVTIILACLPLTTDDYGTAQTSYCWIKATPTGTTWRFIVYWGPVFGGLWLIFLIFCYMIWHASRAIKRYKDGDEFTLKHKRCVRDYLKPLTWYAGAYFFLSLLQFINRVQNAITNQPVFALTLIHVLSLANSGISISVLFFLTNGRKAFTHEKFMDGIRYYRNRMKVSQLPNTIENYDFSMNSTATLQVPRQKVAEPATQLTTLAEVTEDSGVDSTDVLSRDEQ